MRRVTSQPALRRGAQATVLAAVATTTLSGCMYLNPATTDMAYVASDGNNARVGSMQVDNALVVTTGKGSSGSLQGLVTNNSEKPQTLVLTPQGGKEVRIEVPALKSVRLDGKKNGDDPATVSPVTIPSVAQAPGEQMTLTIAVADGDAEQMTIPVLLDQAPYGDATEPHPTSRPNKSGGESGGH